METLDTLAVVEHTMVPFGLDPFQTCQNLGLRTVLVTKDLGGYLKSAARESIERCVDEVIEADTTTGAAVAAALRDSPVLERLCGVFSVTDHSVLAVAEAARALGFPGLSPEAARNARHKNRTRDRCAAAGVPVPRSAWVRSADEARRAASAVGLPCVVKPPSEAGSIGVKLCRTAEEAGEHFDVLDAVPTDRRDQPRPPGVLVEEYLAGYEVSVEMMYLDGEHKVIGVTDKTLSAHPYFAELGQAFPSILPEQEQRVCADLAIRALKATGHDFGAAHVEVKVTSAGPKLIEVNARIAGGQITRLIYEATGLHLPREVIRLHAKRSPNLSGTRSQAAASRYLTSPVSGVVTGVHGLDLARSLPGIATAELLVRAGDPVSVPENNTHIVGFLVAVGSTTGQAIRRADAALGQISIETSADRTGPAEA